MRGRFDPNGPGLDRPGNIELPHDLPAQAPFAALDAGLPLLLLPVRIETRYALGADPPELRIRVFPDQLHVEPGAPAADGSRTPARAALLPGRWVAIGLSEDATLFTVAGAPIAPELRTAPDAAGPPWEVPGTGGLVVDEGLAWMLDYDRAVAAGMAITVPLTGAAGAAQDGIATLLVVGVDAVTPPATAAAALDDLLAAHAAGQGLAFVAQGTATNNTATATSGWSPSAPAGVPARVAARRAPIDLGDGIDGPIGFPRPMLADNASRLAAALGLASDATLRAAPGGADAERSASRAMLRVTYEAILGTLAGRLLRVGATDALSASARDALRAWCLEHVTGGAQQACLRIGPQPYGILPVLRSVAADPATTAGRVREVIELLAPEWRAALPAVPRLDPGATDTAGDDGDLEAIGSLLATQPHPARLFLRRFEAFTEPLITTPQWWWETFVEGALQSSTNPNLASPYIEVGLLESLLSLDNPIESIDEQIALWEAVEAALPDFLESVGSGDGEEDALGYVGAVQGILRGWEERQRPLRWVDLDTYEGVLGETNTALVEGMLSTTTTEWGGEGLVQAPDAPPGHTAADYLADLRDRVAAPGAGLPASGMPGDFLARRPLLYQLLDKTLASAPADAAEQSRIVAALGELAALEPERLEWLLRECLGLGAHRLDAWATSLAAERLDRVRTARPDGLQIGGYGWVCDLAPHDGPALSGGHVHAPSLAHATTAAVLRAGWLAHGTDDPGSPAAVDASSRRVRSASWLLDGVRAGQPLGELLGYAFERSLHDRRADEQIRLVREQVLVASGRPQTPPDEPVDGIALLDLHRDGALELADGDAQDALAEIETLFDAVNDVGLFEAVHQLTRGNAERAAALLDAIGPGTHAPPELRAPLTPRAGIAVEHRVLVLLDPDAPPPGGGWQAGIRDALAPGLEAWVASLLPDPRDVAVGAGASALTLADLGLSALDALYLVGDDVSGESAALRTLLAGSVAGGAPAPQQAPGGVSLAEFAVAAIELRRAIDALRPADARDLRPAHDAGEPERDDAAALDAAASLVRDFDALVDRLSDAVQVGTADAVAPHVERLARLGIATGAAPDDVAGAASLLELAVRRLAAVTAIAVDAADARPGTEARLAALLAGRVPLLGRFPVSPGPAGGVVDTGAGLAGAGETDDWLDAAGRVRPAVGRLAAAGLLSELIAPGGGLRAVAGQAPHVAGEPWAALGRPAGGRLSVCAIVGPGGARRPGEDACGLAADQWSERIPHADHVTGLAFQYDAPSNRPPQAWLLATTPDGEPWSLQLVLDTLVETLDWAKLRAVAPEDLQDFGRAIPTTFVAGGIARWPAEA